MSYDTKCHVLAKEWLEGEGKPHTYGDIAELAQVIQNAIEDWQNYAHPDPPPPKVTKIVAKLRAAR